MPWTPRVPNRRWDVCRTTFLGLCEESVETRFGKFAYSLISPKIEAHSLATAYPRLLVCQDFAYCEVSHDTFAMPRSAKACLDTTLSLAAVRDRRRFHHVSTQIVSEHSPAWLTLSASKLPMTRSSWRRSSSSKHHEGKYLHPAALTVA